MTGMMTDATRATHVMPPRITKPSSSANSPPLTEGGTPNDVSRPDTRLLLCGMLPEPTALISVAAAKNAASHFMRRPRSM